MSRTDVHAPAWVKDRDPAWHNEYREDHNHGQWVVRWEHHPRKWVPIYETVTRCDLGDFLAGAQKTACRMSYAGHRNIYCGCWMCTGHPWQRQDRRRLRHMEQRMLREVLKDHEHDPYVRETRTW